MWFSEIREVYDATEQENVSWEMRHPNANDHICRCLFVGKILIAPANDWCPSRWTVISFIFVKYAQDSCKYYVLTFS